MNYPGFCEKYGQSNMMLVGYFAPVVANTAIQSLLGNPTIDNFLIAFNSGTAGFILANFAHASANRIASRKKMGMTRGGQLVRKFQAASYAVPVALALTYNVVSTFGEESEPATINHQNTSLYIPAQAKVLDTRTIPARPAFP